MPDHVHMLISIPPKYSVALKACARSCLGRGATPSPCGERYSEARVANAPASTASQRHYVFVLRTEAEISEKLLRDSPCSAEPITLTRTGAMQDFG